MKKSLLPILVAATALAAPPTYKIVTTIKIGGAGRWDYSYSDSANHRLYISHGTQTEVVDTSTDRMPQSDLGRFPMFNRFASHI